VATNGELLSQVAERLLPGFLDWANWGDTWTRPLETGSALEWATLAALVSAARDAGWAYHVPLLKVRNGDKLFALRNEVPTAHGAQPGNSAHLSNRLTLAERFLGAMTPKVELSKGKRKLSLFREGCPYHQIMTGTAYKDRPDIFIAAGHVKDGYPKLESCGSKEIVHFSFNVEGIGNASGELRVRNSPVIPCISRSPLSGCAFPARGVVECSVHKSRTVAQKQTAHYLELFSAESIVLVTGNDLAAVGLPNALVRLPGAYDSLVEDLRNVGLTAINAFDMESVGSEDLPEKYLGE